MRYCDHRLFCLTSVILMTINIDCVYVDVVSNRQWWKHTIMYEVYIRSFKDSNDDGIGDINGITSQIEHFMELNIETLWITPFYKSPMLDMGYDITNYTDVDPIFGTLADFDQLVMETKEQNMKLILDLVINHSSDQHPWFKKSIERIDPYTDYYVWKNPKGYDKSGKPLRPNNWTSLFKKPTWTWNKKRKQFYLHNCGEFQPDLNLRNENVVNEIKKIMKFWMKRGIHGFRLDATPVYMEHGSYQDEEKPYQYTMNQPETYVFINKLRTFFDHTFNNNNNDPEKILVAESVQGLDVNINYYGNESFKVVHYPFNFDLQLAIFQDGFPNATFLDKTIKKWLNTIPKGDVVNWVTESHDLPRIGYTLNEQFISIFVTLTMLLPGAVSIYYGQEIGMTGMKMRSDHKQDKLLDFRDQSRTPMQWDKSNNAGFSSHETTWLPVNPNYWKVNVALQKVWPGYTYFKIFRKLSDLRYMKAVRYGYFQSFVPSPWVYAFIREFPNYDTYMVLLNLNFADEYVDLKSIFPRNVPYLDISVSSPNSEYFVGSKMCYGKSNKTVILLRPISMVVFKIRNF